MLRLSQLKDKSNNEKDELICKSGRKPVTTPVGELSECFYDATPPTAVFVRGTVTSHELDNIAHAFLALSDKFGKFGKIEDVFELFGEFEPGQSDVLFSDDGVLLSHTDSNRVDSEDELYKQIQCV